MFIVISVNLVNKHQPPITGYEVVSEIGRTKNDGGVEGVTIGSTM